LYTGMSVGGGADLPKKNKKERKRVDQASKKRNRPNRGKKSIVGCLLEGGVLKKRAWERKSGERPPKVQQ